MLTPQEVVDRLVVGQFGDVVAEFGAHMATEFTEDDLASVWQDAVKRFGGFVAEGDGSVVLHDLDLGFQRGTAHLQLAYRGGRIVGLVIKPGGPSAKFGE